MFIAEADTCFQPNEMSLVNMSRISFAFMCIEMNIFG